MLSGSWASLYTQGLSTPTIFQLRTPQSSTQETTLSCEEIQVQNRSCSHGAATYSRTLQAASQTISFFPRTSPRQIPFSAPLPQALPPEAPHCRALASRPAGLYQKGSCDLSTSGGACKEVCNGNRSFVLNVCALLPTGPWAAHSNAHAKMRCQPGA